METGKDKIPRNGMTYRRNKGHCGKVKIYGYESCVLGSTNLFLKV